MSCDCRVGGPCTRCNIAAAGSCVSTHAPSAVVVVTVIVESCSVCKITCPVLYGTICSCHTTESLKPRQNLQNCYHVWCVCGRPVHLCITPLNTHCSIVAGSDSSTLCSIQRWMEIGTTHSSHLIYVPVQVFLTKAKYHTFLSHTPASVYFSSYCIQYHIELLCCALVRSHSFMAKLAPVGAIYANPLINPEIADN